jgi:hypothetical protein
VAIFLGLFFRVECKKVANVTKSIGALFCFQCLPPFGEGVVAKAIDKEYEKFINNKKFIIWFFK